MSIRVERLVIRKYKKGLTPSLRKNLSVFPAADLLQNATFVVSVSCFSDQ